ncbi:MAG: 50S ribosomal protein L29 [Clostridia bacterium]|nr:50S ribosomal protein L29 [Clostridia bacterium]
MKRRDILVKYRDMTSKELDSALNDLKSELFNLRFQLATGQLENPLKLKSVKKDIARVNSILRERELKA